MRTDCAGAVRNRLPVFFLALANSEKLTQLSRKGAAMGLTP
jgi:hypothetical protein